MPADPKPSRQPPATRWALFVRAARPTGLWVMVLGLILQVNVLPLVALSNPAAAGLISEGVIKILAAGVLGLGVFRTIDKLTGNAT